VFVVVASLTVAGSVASWVAAIYRATGHLGAIEQFMTDHNAVIMMVVLVVLGAELLGQALGVLAT
jgi:hypothetical protein